MLQTPKEALTPERVSEGSGSDSSLDLALSPSNRGIARPYFFQNINSLHTNQNNTKAILNVCSLKHYY